MFMFFVWKVPCHKRAQFFLQVSACVHVSYCKETFTASEAQRAFQEIPQRHTRTTLLSFQSTSLSGLSPQTLSRVVSKLRLRKKKCSHHTMEHFTFSRRRLNILTGSQRFSASVVFFLHSFCKCSLRWLYNCTLMPNEGRRWEGAH